MIEQTHFLLLASAIFVIGAFGLFWNRKNIIVLLMCLEIMLLSTNILFVTFASFAGDLAGQVFVMLILTVAAAEAAVGLAIMVVFFRARDSIAIDDLTSLKG